MNPAELRHVAKRLDRFFSDVNQGTRALMLSAYDQHRQSIDQYEKALEDSAADRAVGVDYSTVSAYYGRRNEDMTMPLFGSVDGKEYLIRRAVEGNEYKFAAIRLDPSGRPFFTVHGTKEEAFENYLGTIIPRKVVPIQEF